MFAWAGPPVVGLLIRVALVTFRNAGFPPGWGGETAAVATALAYGHGFADPYGVPTGPTAHLLPLYPALLGGLFFVLGVSPFAGSCAMYANALFSVAVIWPLRSLGTRYFSPLTASRAAWAWALWPLTGHTEAIYLWSTSLQALIATAVLAVAGTRHWVVHGLLVGIGALTDVPLTAIGTLAILYHGFTRSWAKALGAALLALTIVSPWIVRNLATFDGQVILRSNLGIELARGASEDELAPQQGPIRLPNRDAAELERYTLLGEVAYNREKFEQARSSWRQYPGENVRRVTRRVGAFWIGNPEIAYLYWPSWRLESLKHVVYGLPFFFALVAVSLLVRRRRIEGFLFAAVLMFFPAVYYVATTAPRYRAPIEPLLLCLTSFALLELRPGRVPGTLP
jgi:hypothetical protein